MTLPWWLVPLLLLVLSVASQYVVEALAGGTLVRGVVSGALLGCAIATFLNNRRVGA